MCRPEDIPTPNFDRFLKSQQSYKQTKEYQWLRRMILDKPRVIRFLLSKPEGVAALEKDIQQAVCSCTQPSQD